MSKFDYLMRRKVHAITFHDAPVSALQVRELLPTGYLYDGDGKFRFPAGYQESYVVDGKDYNFDSEKSLEEQKAWDYAKKTLNPRLRLYSK